MDNIQEKAAKANSPGSFTFSVAPMMGCTDRHCRFFYRILSKNVRLYTEMVTADAVIHGNKERLLDFSMEEKPVALQLGGGSPKKLSLAARAGEIAGYQEINLNVGCPSDRVQAGEFGACLMAEPKRVADCIAAMRAAIRIPVTVKCRTGIDDRDSEEIFDSFIEDVSKAGCDTFIIHARKAWLQGLDPKQNREIPPLDYERVYRLKIRRTHLNIVLNGGIRSLDEAEKHLDHVDGVMLGRAIYANPWILSQVDQKLFGMQAHEMTREEAIIQLFPYIEKQLAHGVWLNQISRHLTGIFRSLPGARTWRRILSERAHMPGSGVEIINAALRARRHGISKL
ncbi:MAG: tRNA dihydrouridine(20/20a) synthase DusA [Alphaproteobacteria bacterium]|nr:tRNA dihydrouridine(20/20a) synthase DusA [Alphaproteobacteria bacterium]